MARKFTSADIDYLQNLAGEKSFKKWDENVLIGIPQLRHMLHIKGIGRIEKFAQSESRQLTRLVGEDILVGMHNHHVPIAFQVQNTSTGVVISVGIWAPNNTPAMSESLLRHKDSLSKSLQGIYSAIDIDSKPSNATVNEHFQHAGLVVGVPVRKTDDPIDNSLPIDKLIRAMSSDKWQCLILAIPLPHSEISQIRNAVFNEINDVDMVARQEQQVRNPIREQYRELLAQLLDTYLQGQATGLWRTAVYLIAESEASFWSLTTVWRSIFSSTAYNIEPLTIAKSSDVLRLARDWIIPNVEGFPGPGNYKRPYEYQSILTSTQLSAYIHFPRLETYGFAINDVPNFDIMPPDVKEGRQFRLGEVVQGNRPLGIPFKINCDYLTRHTFVTGITGSGKTNTILHLLENVSNLDIPFWLIESVKTEYRALLQSSKFAGKLRVFTLGDEKTSPFRINPFEVPKGISIGVHIDLLRAVFTASFGLWSPLPQLLEKCLHLIYKDCGWDVTNNTNARLPSGQWSSRAFPTLEDFVKKADEVTRGLGYESQVTMNMRAALHTRFESLLLGTRGAMLNTTQACPMGELLKLPVVFELDKIANDEDKAFVMGLLFIRLVEARRADGTHPNLQHLLILEEAHRIFANVTREKDQEESNPKGVASQLFANILSEIRAYGQGIVIVDQSPSQLSSEAIKSTNLKIAHQIVDLADRSTIGGSMIMTESQMKNLATLSRGQAVIFSEGQDAPILVQIPQSNLGNGKQTDDPELSDYMKTGNMTFADFNLPFSFCATKCNNPFNWCALAKLVSRYEPVIQIIDRVILSFLEDVAALDRLWIDVTQIIMPHLPEMADPSSFFRCVLIHSAHQHADVRGTQLQLDYGVTSQFANRLVDLFIAKLALSDDGLMRQETQQFIRNLYQRATLPYPQCSTVCAVSAPLCLYRQNVSKLISSNQAWLSRWQGARDADRKKSLASGKKLYLREKTLGVCLDAAMELIEFPTETTNSQTLDQHKAVQAATNRVALCFAQQIIVRNEQFLPKSVRREIELLFEQTTQPDREPTT